MFEHRRHLLDKMALVLVENKRLQSSVDDLNASLTLARVHERELELQVVDLEIEKKSLMERLSHFIGEQKGKASGFAL